MGWCLAAAGKQILSARIAMQVLLVDMKEETEKPNEDVKKEKKKKRRNMVKKEKERSRSRHIWGKRLTSKPVDWYKRFA